MAWQTVLGRGLGGLVGRGMDLVWPPRCVFCRSETPAQGAKVVICPACRTLLGGDGGRCPLCGAPSADGVECRHCHGRRRSWDGIAVLGGYSEELRAAVLAAKRPGGEQVVAGLAALFWDRHGSRIADWHPDLVVPVPMHWTRRLARGASAADGLARSIATRARVPCRPLLRRIRATRMQNELPPEDRAANVRGVFRSRSVGGRRVLLVDDVTTTGSTLDECRSALLSAGASAVHAAVVARADRGDTGSTGWPAMGLSALPGE